MQVVKNSVILLILLPLIIIILMPKRELYYMMEKQLSEKNIVISNEEIDEGLLSLTIKHPIIYYGGAEVARVDAVTLWSILIYSKINFTHIIVTEGLPTELRVKNLLMEHSVLAPSEMAVSGQGSVGEINGKIVLSEKKIHINMSKGGEKRAFVKYLKKSKEGWYYESTF